MSSSFLPSANEPLSLLLIEDDAFFADLLEEFLERVGMKHCTLTHASSLAEGRRTFAESQYDVVLLDLSLPDSHGLDTLDATHAMAPRTPIIVLTGDDDEERAVMAMRMGAQDYLPKAHLRANDFARAIMYAVERTRLLHHITESEQLFHSTFEQAPVGIAHASFQWEFQLANGSCCELLGYTVEELVGQAFTELVSSSLAHSLLVESQRLLTGECEQFSLERRYQKDDRSIWMHLTVSIVRERSALGGYFILILEDVTSQKEAEKMLRRNAHYDLLTGLPNRTLLIEQLKCAIARRKRHSDYLYALLFLDLDRFKTINDSLGHLAGDALLVDVARRLTTVLRQEDTVARWGGDEFVIILDSIEGIDDAIEVARRLQQRISVPYLLHERELFLSASIGILLCSADYEHPEELLRDADIAMYKAKESGRSQHIVFEELMRNAVHKRLQLDSALRRAIERQELRAHYQPIVSLDDGGLVGFEALVRWQHPNRGIVSPGDFLPLAEENGFIKEIDQWILGDVCQQLRTWHTQFNTTDLSVSVNLSSRHFANDDIIDVVAQALDESQIPSECLHLEITESAIIKNQSLAIPILSKLKQLGVKIYMDDFGTGYSSLSYLQRFPLDVLKIDRSFISAIGQSQKQEKIIELIVLLAKNIGLKVVAEGIETVDQQGFLQALLCAYGQGYFYSKPMATHDATSYIGAHFLAH